MPHNPPLSYRDVVRILKNLGFTPARHASGSHETWKLYRTDRWYSVTVYFHGGQNFQFPPKTLKSMIEQSGFSPDEFYSARKKKIIKT